MVALGGVMQACTPLPEVRYETDRLEIAPEFGHPVCAGTLERLDEHLGEVERSLGFGTARRDPLRVYWMVDGIEDYCREGSRGCFFPGTRVLFARGASIAHEMVHAVLDSGGETYFVEEGMAELFSGVGVSFDVEAESTPLSEGLALSRADYRGRGLDYAAAAHFVRWVHDTAGVRAMTRLAKEVGDDADGSRLRRTVEDIFDASLDDVEVSYALGAPRFYRSLYESRLPEIDLAAAHRGIERELDCGATHTRGPLWDDRPGMFRIERVVIPRSGDVRLEVSGDAEGGWVAIFDPYAGVTRRAVTDWTLPDPSVDPATIWLQPGEVRKEAVSRGTYLVVFGSEEPTRPVRLSLRLELARLPGPGTEAGGPS